MMIGSPTPTVEPLTGLNVGGTNGGSPTNGAGFCPVTGPAGTLAGTAGAGANGLPGAGGGGAKGSPGAGGGGATSGLAGGGGASGSAGAGGGGASTPGAGGGSGTGSGSARAEPLAKVSTAVIPAALSAATIGPLVHRDIVTPPVTFSPSMHSGYASFCFGSLNLARTLALAGPLTCGVRDR